MVAAAAAPPSFAESIYMPANFAMCLAYRRNNNMGFIGLMTITILTPLGASLIQRAISNSREY